MKRMRKRNGPFERMRGCKEDGGCARLPIHWERQMAVWGYDGGQKCTQNR